MPTNAERIEAIKARMEGREKKLEDLKVVQRTKAANQADREVLDKLQAQEAAEKADQNRKADAAGKLLLGAGFLRAEEPLRSRGVMTAIVHLNPRDQDRAKSWAKDRKVDLAAVPFTVEPVAVVPVVPVVAATLVPSAPPEPVEPPAPVAMPLDPTTPALLRVFAQIEAAERSMIEGVFLSTARGEDRLLLERFFADLGKDDDAEVELIGAGSRIADESEQPNNGQHGAN